MPSMYLPSPAGMPIAYALTPVPKKLMVCSSQSVYIPLNISP